MLDMAQSVLQPVIVDLLTWAIGLMLAAVASGLPGFLRRRVEAVDREAIYHAVDTSATLLFAAARRTPSVVVTDAMVTAAATQIMAKMPGVVRRLAPSKVAIEDMLRAELQRRTDDLLGRDRLAEALRQAGVPVPA